MQDQLKKSVAPIVAEQAANAPTEGSKDVESTVVQEDEQLLKVPEVAVRLALVPFQVRRLIWRGDLPSVRIGRAVRVRRCDVVTFIQACPSGAKQ